MALNPLAPQQMPMPPGASIPGMNTQPYPSLGPAQGGIGPGAEENPREQEQPRPDNVANIARLLTLFGIQPGDPRAIGVAAGLGAQSLIRMARKGDEQFASRGITDAQTGVHAQPPMPQGMPGVPQPPQLGAPGPAMIR